MQFLYIFTASTSSLKQPVMLKNWVLVQLGGSILVPMLCMTIEWWQALSCLCAFQSIENMRAGTGTLRWQARQTHTEPWPLHIHSGLEIIPLIWPWAPLALCDSGCARTFCEASGWGNLGGSQSPKLCLSLSLAWLLSGPAVSPAVCNYAFIY